MAGPDLRSVAPPRGRSARSKQSDALTSRPQGDSGRSLSSGTASQPEALSPAQRRIKALRERVQARAASPLDEAASKRCRLASPQPQPHG